MKILVIHVSAGAGHTKAAEAIRDGLTHRTGHAVTFVDALDYATGMFRYSYRSGYGMMVSKAPWLWGFFFWLTGIVWLLPVVMGIRRILYSIHARRLKAFLVQEQFDCIISTHFFPNVVAGHLKKAGRIRSKIISIITDYDVHTIWLADCIDIYAVACQHTKERLLSLRVSGNHIAVTGIPIHEKFASRIDVDELRKEFAILPGAFVVLVATGSFGIGPIEDIARKLTRQHTLIVCGHNKTLFAKLSSIKRKNVTVFGLVNNMHELMAAADAMITKPGGLSITEALVSGLPLIFFSAIPGQETNNIAVLKRYGIGARSRNVSAIADEINRLSDSSEYLSAAKEHIQKLSRPAAVHDIIALIE